MPAPRENNSEFGGSAVIAKALRSGLSTIYSNVSDKRTNPRLVKAIQSIIVRGATGGTRGIRPFNPLTFKSELEGFEFNNGTLFNSIFNAEYSFNVPLTRSQLTLTIADFNALGQVNAPQYSHHSKKYWVKSNMKPTIPTMAKVIFKLQPLLK